MRDAETYRDVGNGGCVRNNSHFFSHSQPMRYYELTSELA